MNKKNVNYILLLVAVLWGFGFSATKVILDAGISVNMFIFIRFLIGGIVIALYYKNLKKLKREEILIGLASGTFLFLFFTLQTTGLSMTTIANTALYTGTVGLITPFIAYIISKRKIKITELTAGGLLILAIYVNNIGQITKFNLGDILVLLSAVTLALNISVMGKYMKNQQVENITVVSLFTCSLFGLTFGILNQDQLLIIPSVNATLSLLYLGVLTTAFAFVVQNKALKYTSEGTVSFILGTEAIWGIIAAVLVYGESISINTIISIIIISIGFYILTIYKSK